MTDTDETKRKRSDAARKGAATKGPEGRRAASLKAAATKGPEVVRQAARKAAASRDPEAHREAIRKAAAARSPERRREMALKALANRDPEAHREAIRKALAARSPDGNSDELDPEALYLRKEVHEALHRALGTLTDPADRRAARYYLGQAHPGETTPVERRRLKRRPHRILREDR